MWNALLTWKYGKYEDKEAECDNQVPDETNIQEMQTSISDSVQNLLAQGSLYVFIISGFYKQIIKIQDFFLTGLWLFQKPSFLLLT